MAQNKNTLKLLKAKVKRNVYYKNTLQEVEFFIYRNYFSIFGYPIFSVGKSYAASVTQTGEYYEQGVMGNMPEDLLEIAKDISRIY